MDDRVKSLVKSEIWSIFCEEIMMRIKRSNGEPVPTDSPTVSFHEACRREGKAEILQILRSIQDETFKEDDKK